MKRIADVPLEVLEFQGHTYSTLDFCPPDAKDFLNKSKSFPLLREGWELAPASDELRTAVVQHKWGGASWLILGNGSAYSLKGTADSQAFTRIFRTLDVEKALLCLYKTARHNFQVLIRTKSKTTDRSSPFAQKVVTSMFKKRRFTDFSLVCGGQDLSGPDRQELACHRAVLAEASPVFEAALSANMVESQQSRLEIHDAEPHIVERMLSFVYTGALPGPSVDPLDNVKLMTLADRYGMEELISLCSPLVLDHLDVQSVIPVTRALKHHANHRVLGPILRELQDKVAASPELLSAVLQGV